MMKMKDEKKSEDEKFPIKNLLETSSSTSSNVELLLQLQ